MTKNGLPPVRRWSSSPSTPWAPPAPPPPLGESGGKLSTAVRLARDEVAEHQPERVVGRHLVVAVGDHQQQRELARPGDRAWPAARSSRRRPSGRPRPRSRSSHGSGGQRGGSSAGRHGRPGWPRPRALATSRNGPRARGVPECVTATDGDPGPHDALREGGDDAWTCRCRPRHPRTRPARAPPRPRPTTPSAGRARRFAFEDGLHSGSQAAFDRPHGTPARVRGSSCTSERRT